MLPLLPLTELTWVLQPRGMLIILHLGLVTTAVAYLLFARGLRQISTAAAVTLTLAEPLVAGMLGVLLLGERFGGAQSGRDAGPGRRPAVAFVAGVPWRERTP